MQRNVSTFWALLDISFTDFVTESLIKVLYIISIALAVIAVIIGVVVIFANYGVAEGIGAIILSPIVLLAYILLVRVVFELFIVVFKIADYLEIIAENTRPETEE